jgi:hypothetical protein
MQSVTTPAPLATWRRPFLEALAQIPNVSRAARIAGISRQWACECRTNDPSFAAEWEEALEQGIESLEEKAWERAKGEGIQFKFNPKTGKPLLHPETGQPYYEHVASDAMATLLLKAHRPEKYKDRSAVDVNATVAVKPAHDLSKLTLDELLILEYLTRKIRGTDTIVTPRDKYALENLPKAAAWFLRALTEGAAH